MKADNEYIKKVKGDCHRYDNSEIVNVMVDAGGHVPVRAHADDAGADIFAVHDIVLWPRSFDKVDSRVHVQLKPGTVGLLTGRSSMAARGITVALGIIDSGYNGSLGIVLMNQSDVKQEIKAGDRIAQLLVIQCETPSFNLVDHFEDTDRGDSGFGSTGR